MRIFPVSDEIIYFPSGVISACVTIAPRGLSASFVNNRPDRVSQTPTQPRVTVTAKSTADKLKL